MLSRGLYFIMATVGWAGYLLALWSFWPRAQVIAEAKVPGSGVQVAAMVLGFLVLLGVLVQAMLKDLITPARVSDEEQAKQAAERFRARAERDGAQLLAKGDTAGALALYERAGMVMQALKLAEDTGDKHALIRLHTQMGRHERARRLHLEMEDYEGAAQSSALLGEIADSRGYYRQAADAALGREGTPPATLAALWDRAGFPGLAAPLHEGAGAMDKAAESFDLVGDADGARRCGDQARALEAYEKRQAAATGGMAGAMAVVRDAKYYADLTKGAEMMESLGDFFGAAEMYRDAHDPAQAGRSFERFLEYERAARCFEKAALPEKAASARGERDKLETMAADAASALGVERDPAADGSVSRKRSELNLDGPGASTPIPATPSPEKTARPMPAVTAPVGAATAGALPRDATQGIKPVKFAPAAGAVAPLVESTMERQAREAAESAVATALTNAMSGGFTFIAPPRFVAPGTAVPAGGWVAPSFQGLTAQSVQFVPVFMPAGAPAGASVYATAAPTYDPAEMAGMLRKGDFLAASDLAAKGNDWLMAAALKERGGRLLEAADLYRRIGKEDEAAHCLGAAGRLRESAMLSLAVGRRGRGLRTLLRALAEGKAETDAAILPLAADVLFEMGGPDRACAFLSRRIAPSGFDEATAPLAFALARRLHRAGAHPQAHGLYRSLLADGAESPELSAAEARLAAMLGRAPFDRGPAAPVEAAPARTDADDPPFAPPPDGRTTVPAGSRVNSAEFPGKPPRDSNCDGTVPQKPGSEEAPASPPRKPGRSVMDFLKAAVEDTDSRDRGSVIIDQPDDDNGPPTVVLPNFHAGPDADGRRRFVLATPPAADSAAEAAGSLAPGGAARPEMSLFGAPAKTPSGLGAGAHAPRRAASHDPATDDPFSQAQRYSVRKELSRGGMGVVYEATDNALGRAVALKLIQRRQAGNDELQQFLIEARAIARLSHPNVVTVYDIGLLDMKHYIAMELLRGGPLGQWVKDEGRLKPRDALRVLAETARGLGAAHKAGIIHRDIKPGNLLLTERRDIKIVDFGLAKLNPPTDAEGRDAAPDADDAPKFPTAGTPGFMAPEQIHGDEINPRTDIYALGTVFYHCLTGEPPYKTAGFARTRQILDFQLQGRLPSPKALRDDLPDDFEVLYRGCTELRPEDRYQTVDEFLPAVERMLATM